MLVYIKIIVKKIDLSAILKSNFFSSFADILHICTHCSYDC